MTNIIRERNFHPHRKPGYEWVDLGNGLGARQSASGFTARGKYVKKRGENNDADGNDEKSRKI